jgi:hypothetical protein
MVMDIFLIALGLGAIAIAMFAKSYYWGRGMGEGPLSKPAPAGSVNWHSSLQASCVWLLASSISSASDGT